MKPRRPHQSSPHPDDPERHGGKAPVEEDEQAAPEVHDQDRQRTGTDQVAMGQTFADVRAYQQGDTSALGRLYERYFERVLSVVRIRMGSKLRERIEPEDVVQKTFEVAMEHLNSFEMREPGAMIHWLSKLAENQIRDQLKYWEADKRNWDREHRPLSPWKGSSSSWTVGLLTGSTTLPPDRVMRDEMREIVETCIEELPDDYREVILMRMVSGASLDYTAEKMERTTGAVAMLHARAKLRLMEAIQRRLGPDGAQPRLDR